MKYYSLKKILQHDATYNVIIGERSNGKTFAVHEHALKVFWATGGQLAHHLRRYSYAVGKVAVLEELMDKLFIAYDDHGRVKELPL